VINSFNPSGNPITDAKEKLGDMIFDEKCISARQLHAGPGSSRSFASQPKHEVGPMRTLSSIRCVVTAASVAAIAWIATAQQPRNVDNAALKNAAKNVDERLTYGRDYAETHYSPLKQIDTTDVSRLGLAWSWETESPAGANVEATPLMANGVFYGSLGWDVMFAVEVRTGKLKWQWDPEIPREHISTLCCGPVNRGVALYNGRVYAGLLDGTLVALDQETGKPVWRVKVTENADITLTAAVRVVKGRIIVGSSGAEHAVRGFFAALRRCDRQAGVALLHGPGRSFETVRAPRTETSGEDVDRRVAVL
jgi:glucose dehydrogenase